MSELLAGQHTGLVALMIALGGTSYAAVRLPSHSVGTAQLKNGAVTSTKLTQAVVPRWCNFDPRVGGRRLGRGS